MSESGPHRPPESRLSAFLAELKRRRVVRVLLVYGGVSFAVLQAADILVETYRLPGRLQTIVGVLILLGLPISLILAWLFDVTDGGIRRTESAEAPSPHSQPAAWVSVRTIALAAGLLLVGAAGGWLLRPAAAPATGEATESGAARDAGSMGSSIAVLPFVDLSPTGDQRYLGDGLADELLNVLAQVPELKVAARTSAFAFRGEDVDVRAVGERLGVRTVLEGSVRREGDRLRVTAQLIDVESGFHLWSQTYDRELESVFAIQDEMSGAIARALRVPLGLLPGDRPAGGRTDPETYELYLQGRHMLHDREIDTARRRFEAALARDSSFAAAWGGLAEVLALEPYLLSATWDEALPRAEAAARRALELDSTLVSAHRALANVLRDRWDWEAAERAYLRALALNPDDVEALNQYGQYFMLIGDGPAALDRFRRARELDPLSPLHTTLEGVALWFMRRYDEAAAAMERGLALEPDFLLTVYLIERLYASMGRFEDAERIARRHMPLAVTLVRGVADPEARDEALEALSKVERLPDFGNRPIEGTVAEYVLAGWYPLLGAHEETLAMFERLSHQGAGAAQLFWYPEMDPYRDEPAFRRALERVGFPERAR